MAVVLPFKLLGLLSYCKYTETLKGLLRTKWRMLPGVLLTLGLFLLCYIFWSLAFMVVYEPFSPSFSRFIDAFLSLIGFGFTSVRVERNFEASLGWFSLTGLGLNIISALFGIAIFAFLFRKAFSFEKEPLSPLQLESRTRLTAILDKITDLKGAIEARDEEGANGGGGGVGGGRVKLLERRQLVWLLNRTDKQLRSPFE